MYPLLSGPGLPCFKRLPGPYAYSGPPRAGQRHWSAGAPLPAAERLTSVPGPTGGAVPQAHVPLLSLWGSRSPNTHLQSVLSVQALDEDQHWGPTPLAPKPTGVQLQRSRPRQHVAVRVMVAGRQVWLTDTAWSRAWEKHFRSELKAACSSSPLNSVRSEYWLASCNIQWDSTQHNMVHINWKSIFHVTICNEHVLL